MKKRFSQILLVFFLLLGIVLVVDHFSGYQKNPNALKVWFFDVGQGDAILFETPEKHQILIDGGPDRTILNRLSEVMPLRDKTIDLLIITHNHADHIAGAIEVLKHYTVNEVWLTGAIHTTDTYQNLLELIKQKNIKTQTVSQGDRVSFGKLEGIVLWPDRDVTGIMPEDQNTLSLTTFWQYYLTTFLMTGDLKIEQELILARNNLLKPTTVLKVAHQGSRTSTSEQLLQIIKPEVAVISVGENSYGHPHRSVIERLERLAIPILRTDQNQTILFTVHETGYAYSLGL